MATIDTSTGKPSKKDDLKSPDAFLSTMDKGVNAIERNRTMVTAIVAALFISAFAYVIYEFMAKRNEKAAADALYTVEAEYMKLREGFERAKFEAANPKAKEQVPPGTAPAVAASGDLQKDYGNVLPGLEKIAQDYSSRAAGAQAALMASDLYLQYRKPEQALVTMEKVVGKQSSSSLMYGATYMMRASALAAKGDCTQAINDWKKVLDTKASSAMHPDALLKSGVCYESLNQNDKAVEAYRKVTTDYADTAAAQTAKSYLRAVEMKAPSAAPAAAEATTPKAG